MSVYDLYQSYLDQAKASPVMTSPVTDPNYLLYLQQQQQGGGDGPRGGGAFGNLDLSRGKEVTRDVYQDVLGPPGAFEFSPETMMAYPNLSSGLYQTYEGRNVDAFLSNTGATFGLAGLGMKMLGMQPKTVGGFVPGSIRGMFDTPSDILSFISGANRREAQAKQQEALEKAAAAKRNIQQYTGGGGDGAASRGGGSSYGTRSESGWESSPF